MRQSPYHDRSLHRILNDVSTLWTHQQCAVKISSSQFNSPATIHRADCRPDLLTKIVREGSYSVTISTIKATDSFMTENVFVVSAQL